MQKTKTRIKLRKRNKGERGAALLLTLVAVTVASVAAATVATVVTSHNSRVRTDQDSLRALYAADAAMNYQAQRLFANLSNDQVGYDGTNVEAATYGFKGAQIPVQAKKYNLSGTATLNDFLGLNTSGGDNAKCWVQYASDPAGTRALDLSSTDPLYIYGTATVNGVTRTVRVTASGKALFSTWGVFTNGPLQVGGALTATPAAGTTSSLVGSNSSISVSSHTASGCTQVAYGHCHPDTSIPYKSGGCSVHLPSIDTLANGAAGGHSGCGNCTGGVAQFATNNDNQTCGRCCDSYSWTQPMPTSGNVPSNGSCQMYLTGKSGGTNIYLPSLTCSNLRIWADVSKGPVNVWVNNTCSANNPSCHDKVDGDVDICPYSSWDSHNNQPLTSNSDCSKLHIYYSNQCGSLNLKCNGTKKKVCGQIYAYNTFGGTSAGTVTIGTTHHPVDTTVNGQIYSQSLTTNGSLNVVSPPVAQPTDGAGLMFTTSTKWQEVSPINGN